MADEPRPPGPRPPDLALHGLQGLPLVRRGDSLAELLLAGLADAGLDLRPGDVLVVAQKIVSKAEGRTVDLADVEASTRARELAVTVDKDPRLVELILRESRQVLRARTGVLVVEDRRGLVLANAGIDHSNVEQSGRGEATSHGETTVLLLPEDPDRSAAELRHALRERTGVEVGVVIADSLGRAWRLGTVGVAIGCAGIDPLQDLRGRVDLFGSELRTTDVGHADQLAAAASIVMGQVAEAVPAVLVRGLSPDAEADRGPATAVLRPVEQDLFR